MTALAKYLKDEYVVLSLDFQGLDADQFQTGERFTQALAQMLIDEREFNGAWIPPKQMQELEALAHKVTEQVRMADIFRIFKRWCLESDKPVLLMIDEVDRAANNQVFLDFLAQLRDGYISRDTKGAPAFKSVILAGVTDVKNLKRKLRPEDTHKFNSPWNIAADFNVDMSLSANGIAGMLSEYEKDHHTGMDTMLVAKEIYSFTGGYPYLVSRICQLMETQLAGGRLKRLPDVWTVAGVSEAVRLVYDNPNMGRTLERMLFAGDVVSYNAYNLPLADAEMYGFVRNDHGNVAISNKIFETLLYNYFLSTSEIQGSKLFRAGANDKSEFIVNGRLLMEKLLTRFITVFEDLYADQKEKFDEAEGRRRFLLYIRPVINGTGNYYIEPQTRDNKRMDMVIDYLGERHVVELKIWGGKSYHQKGEVQLAEYLEYYHMDKGYLLTYSFIKSKKQGITHVKVNGKELVEAPV